MGRAARRGMDDTTRELGVGCGAAILEKGEVVFDEVVGTALRVLERDVGYSEGPRVGKDTDFLSASLLGAGLVHAAVVGCFASRL